MNVSPGHSDQTIQKLLEWLEDLHPRRAGGVHPLGPVNSVASAGRAGVPVLVSALKEGSDPVRKLAALVLGDMGPEARAAVPALIEALHDGHDDVRRRAAVALGEIGGEARAAVPALLAAMQDAHAGVRKMAAWALGEITPRTSWSRAA
ncbi:MAG: HEAT repeat domain-containing protein [Planctomycetes bacterium]|nr:HEAT repeat domain-containing protein [Planctomycetota bacterium]